MVKANLQVGEYRLWFYLERDGLCINPTYPEHTTHELICPRLTNQICGGKWQCLKLQGNPTIVHGHCDDDDYDDLEKIVKNSKGNPCEQATAKYVRKMKT